MIERPESQINRLVTAFLSMDNRRQNDLLVIAEDAAKYFPRPAPDVPPIAS